MCRQHFFMRRKIFIALLLGIIILPACKENESIRIDNESSIVETVENEFQKEENDAENIKGEEAGQSYEHLTGPLEVPVNTKAEEVYYYSEESVPLLASGFGPGQKSDGKHIYLAQLSSAGEPDLYAMPIGTASFSPMKIDLPEGMDICNYTIDFYGNIHLLIADIGRAEYFIWQLDESYQVDKVMDISAYMEEKQMPVWFLIHRNGTYYIQWGLDRNGIIVDSEGVLMHQFTTESLGITWTREAAVGKDGEVYIVYGSSDTKWEIGKFDMMSYTLKNENPALSFPGDEIFAAMSGGTDTNLLLFSPYSGVWACDTEEGIMENRVLISDIRQGFDMDSEFWLRMFLPDGRLLLLGQAKQEERVSDIEGERPMRLLFKYVPVGK